jgi:hypothetical protein
MLPRRSLQRVKGVQREILIGDTSGRARTASHVGNDEYSVLVTNA